MKKKTQLAVVLVAVLTLAFGGLAYATTMNAGMGLGGSVSGTPDLLTATQIDFGFSGGYSIFATAGDFYWDGTGTQPAYTINPLTDAGKIGGSSVSLTIGDISSYSGGSNFLTWYVNPTPSTTDLVTFNVTSEQIVSKTSTSGSQNLTVYLLGTASDANGHWSTSPASLNLTFSKNGSTYSWAGTWTSPPTSATPEASTILLFGLGLTMMAGVTMRNRANGQAECVSCG